MGTRVMPSVFRIDPDTENKVLSVAAKLDTAAAFQFGVTASIKSSCFFPDAPPMISSCRPLGASRWTIRGVAAATLSHPLPGGN